MIYYIFGYCISGCHHTTENVVTENVIHPQNMYNALGQNRWDGVWRRESESVTWELLVVLNFLANPSSNMKLIIHLFKTIWIRIHVHVFYKCIEWEMIIILWIIQSLPDYYYIYGYYISGCDHPTENVIYSTKPVWRKGWNKTHWIAVAKSGVESVSGSCWYIDLNFHPLPTSNTNVD